MLRSPLLTFVAIGLFGLANGAAAQSGVTTGTSTTNTDSSGATTTITQVNGPAATSAEAQAESAQIAAFNSAFSNSGITPGVSPGTNSGVEESSLLVAAALNSAANEIVSKIANFDKPVLVIPGNSGLDFSAWQGFELRLSSEVRRLKNDLKTFDDNKKRGKTKRNTAPTFTALSGVPAFEEVGEIAGAIGKLLSYVATNYQSSGVTVSTTDYMLAVAVAGHAPRKTVIFTQAMAIGAVKALSKEMEPLEDNISLAQQDIAEGNRYAAAEKKAAFQKQSENLDNAIAALKADISSYEAFMTSLYGGLSGTTVVAGNLSSVLQQYAASKILGADDGGVLFVQVHNASGGFYTKTNLWSTLGAMPLYASGGVVVSFALYAKSFPSSAEAELERCLAQAAASQSKACSEEQTRLAVARAEFAARNQLLKTIIGDGKTQSRSQGQSENQQPDEIADNLYSLQSAGLFGVMTPYHTIGHVLETVELDKSGDCDAISSAHAPGVPLDEKKRTFVFASYNKAYHSSSNSAEPPSSDAEKYCPR